MNENKKIIAENVSYSIRVEDKLIVFSPTEGGVEHIFDLPNALVFEQEWQRAIARLSVELSRRNE